MRKRSVGFLVAALVAKLLSCRSVTPTTDGAQPPAPGAVSTGSARAASARPHWDGKGSARLFLTDFHFELGGTQVLAVDETGHVRDLFVRHEIVPITTYCSDAGPERTDACRDLVRSGQKDVGTHRWLLADYTLSPEALVAFRKTLFAADFGALERHYSSTTEPDGTTHGYFLTTREGRVETSAYSTREPAEPPRLFAVRSFLLDQQAAHEEARKRAPEVRFQVVTDMLAEAEGKPSP